MKDNIINLKNLSISYSTTEGDLSSIHNINLGFERGKITGLIGESGCGKSTLMNSILKILASNAIISNNSEVLFDDIDILKMNKRDLQKFRWMKVSMIFQAAQNALNPTLTINEQLMDSILDHNPNTKKHLAQARLSELLKIVNLDPERILEAYPHELSGGMRQRVIIAMAYTLMPELIILDEPTTALDVITQSYILDLLQKLQREQNLSMILVTHDLVTAAKLSDNMVIMYGGEIMEVASTEELFSTPLHPYTQKLLNSIPFIDGKLKAYAPEPCIPVNLLKTRSGCIFSENCSMANESCLKNNQSLIEINPGHFVACHLVGTL